MVLGLLLVPIPVPLAKASQSPRRRRLPNVCAITPTIKSPPLGVTSVPTPTPTPTLTSTLTPTTLPWLIAPRNSGFHRMKWLVSLKSWRYSCAMVTLGSSSLIFVLLLGCFVRPCLKLACLMSECMYHELIASFFILVFFLFFSNI
jgi:hypothetical protein